MFSRFGSSHCRLYAKVISFHEIMTHDHTIVYFSEATKYYNNRKVRYYDGAVESFLNPKLTNRRKSEKTSRRGFSVRLSPVLDPVGGPLGPGPIILPKMPSLIVPPRGRIIRLAPGLTRLPPA